MFLMSMIATFYLIVYERKEGLTVDKSSLIQLEDTLKHSKDESDNSLIKDE